MNAPAVRVWFACAAMAAAAGAARAQETAYRVVEAFPQLEFRRPVDLQSARDGSGRLFVVEQDGVIRWFANRADAREAPVFLDLRDRVNRDGNEMGLLGLAFHPDFAKNGRFFVDYTATKLTRRITRVSGFEVGAYPRAADIASESVVIEIGQPWANHNGGQIAFGPDGFLYIAMGDGGSGGDPQGNGQDRRSLLGKILRIDVSKKPYAVPADNPFAGNREGWRPEIWAWGLRNPWRFSFDPATGRLWAGDVGQVTWEEINIVEKGGNYGWDCREGFHPYEPARERSEACGGARDLRDPVWAYGRDQGVSVTGGHVYHGRALPDLAGWYVYADYGTGRVWALRIENGRAVNRQIAHAELLISSFGVDENGELYLCAHDPSNGRTKIHRLEAK